LCVLYSRNTAHAHELGPVRSRPSVLRIYLEYQIVCPDRVKDVHKKDKDVHKKDKDVHKKRMIHKKRMYTRKTRMYTRKTPGHLERATNSPATNAGATNANVGPPARTAPVNIWYSSIVCITWCMPLLYAFAVCSASVLCFAVLVYVVIVEGASIR